MPVVRTQRLFLKNLKGQEYTNYIFGNELILAEDEDSIEIALVQASIPPLALHLLVHYQIGVGNNFTAEIPIEMKSYGSVGDLATEIQNQFALYPIPAFSPLSTYIQASTSGGKIRFTSTIGLPATDPYVYDVEIDSITLEQLLGFPIGVYPFPGVAPNRVDGLNDPILTTSPTAVYIHTDLNASYRNIDNIQDTTVFQKSDVFAKCEYSNSAGGQFSYFFDSTKGYMLNLKGATLSQMTFFITDLNRAILHPQRDWGMCLEILYRKKPDYNEIVANNILREMRDYLRFMWLSNPPQQMRKQIGS